MQELIKQSLLFPVIQSIHIIGIVLLVGTISLVDFRLLGVAMRRQPVPALALALAPWTIAGLITIFVTGPLLFWSDIPRYVRNPAFVIKMILLAVALTLHFSVHRSAIRSDERSEKGRSQLAAVLSLALWSAVLL